MILNKYLKNEDNDIPQMKVYRGKRVEFDLAEGKRGNCNVTVGGQLLYNVDDIEWEWGYKGQRAKNLARSLLFDFFGEESFSEELVIMFRDKFVAQFQFMDWQIEEYVINGWLDFVEQKINWKRQ